MKFPILLLLSLATAASVSIGESFIDSLFSELVTTPSTSRQQILNSIQPPQYQETLFDPQSFLQSVRSMDDTELLSLLSSFKSSDYEFNAMEYSHHGYLKYRSSLNLPSDDDTSDLYEARNLFGGIVTFGGFRHFQCFNPSTYGKSIDIAIVGAPFDTGTSYRPGARMGPEAIRSSARRLGEGITPVRGNGKLSKLSKINPYNATSHNLSIIDCGDVPMTPFDNRVALNQLYRAQKSIHSHKSKVKVPKIITLGGDHTITLMALRSAYENHGPLSVIHFDSHIDTWDPKVLGGGISSYMSLNHGTFLHYAAEKGYLSKDHCSHVGLRAPYISADYDKKHDHDCGFHTITARDMDSMGREAIVARLKEIVGNRPVYISVDIDVLDPSTAPGTGTMEVGGWTTRELISVLDGLEGLNVVGADVVEVSPPYDTNSEITSLAATAVVDSFLGLMIVTE